MSKVYIKIPKEASGTRSVLINRTESCEKDSWEPLNPWTTICVKVFGEWAIKKLLLPAEMLARYLDCERVYGADYISRTDEIRIDALDDEVRSRTVKLTGVCFEVTRDADWRFKRLSISRMTTYEVGQLESMYRNAHEDPARTEPRVFRGGEEGNIANHGVDITVFDPEKALEPDKKYFGYLLLVIVPGEREPRFKIVFTDCSRVEAYREYFDKTKRVYQFPSSPELPEERLVILNSRQGGKSMTIHAMYLEAMGAIRVRKNAGCGVPKIERVIFNAPAVIVMWADGSKTVVKAQKGERFDPEKGLAMAISKKALGNGSKYYDTFKAWVPEKKKPARKPKAKKVPTEE